MAVARLVHSRIALVANHQIILLLRIVEVVEARVAINLLVVVVKRDINHQFDILGGHEGGKFGTARRSIHTRDV